MSLDCNVLIIMVRHLNTAARKVHVQIIRQLLNPGTIIAILNKNVSTRIKRTAFGCHMYIFQETLKHVNKGG